MSNKIETKNMEKIEMREAPHSSFYGEDNDKSWGMVATRNLVSR